MKILPAIATLVLAACQAGAADNTALCTDVERVNTLPSPLYEASGIVASRTHPGIFWVHNDSEGTPALYALDASGGLVAEIEMPGARTQADWEDIAIGPCAAGDCIYIGDIGDNLHDRTDRAILRLAEPGPTDDAAVHRVERFPVRYPDGPRDAEAMFVLPDTTLFIITKGREGSVTLFRYPPPFRENEPVTLEPLQELTPGLVQLPDLITGADALADGSIVAVRSYSHIQLYRVEGDTLAPVWPGSGFDLAELAEPQGEGITLLPDGTVYLVSETGPFRDAPPFSRLRCTLP
ncbi:MAG TPA: hypothetical protein VK929_17370 [Longimicrobiales bacterium]|nr:hypothetical protein [Longimicrobiales bacterium]